MFILRRIHLGIRVVKTPERECFVPEITAIRIRFWSALLDLHSSHDLTSTNWSARSYQHKCASRSSRKKVKLVLLLRQLRFFRQSNYLNTALYYVVETVLRNTLTEDNNILSTTDVEEMMETIPDVDTILVPGFFSRVPFPF